MFALFGLVHGPLSSFLSLVAVARANVADWPYNCGQRDETHV